MDPAIITEVLQNVPYVVLVVFCLLIANRGADMAGTRFAKALVFFVTGLGGAVLTLALMYNR